MRKIPFCFYPTTVMMIDDRPDFTNWVSLNLGLEGKCQVFNSGVQALKVLKKYQVQSFLNRLFPKEEFYFVGNPEHKNIIVDLEKIQDEANFPDHEDELSVIIIDYEMPGINGLELCREIVDLPVKKMMLTGEADHTIAVEAFNDGVIDRFVLKTDPNLVEVINQTVFELQLAYFYDLSRSMIESAQNGEENQIVCLTDAIFANYFYDLMQQHHIKEFYLLNHFGDFMLCDQHGHWFELGVRDQKAVDGLHHLAEDLLKQEPDESEIVLKELLAGKRLPFFPKEFNEYQSLKDWIPYFRDVVEVRGSKSAYYCTFFAISGRNRASKN